HDQQQCGARNHETEQHEDINGKFSDHGLAEGDVGARQRHGGEQRQYGGGAGHRWHHRVMPLPKPAGKDVRRFVGRGRGADLAAFTRPWRAMIEKGATIMDGIPSTALQFAVPAAGGLLYALIWYATRRLPGFAKALARIVPLLLIVAAGLYLSVGMPLQRKQAAQAPATAPDARQAPPPQEEARAKQAEPAPPPTAAPPAP